MGPRQHGAAQDARYARRGTSRRHAGPPAAHAADVGTPREPGKRLAATVLLNPVVAEQPAAQQQAPPLPSVAPASARSQVQQTRAAAAADVLLAVEFDDATLASPLPASPSPTRCEDSTATGQTPREPAPDPEPPPADPDEAALDRLQQFADIEGYCHPKHTVVVPPPLARACELCFHSPARFSVAAP